MSIKLGLILPHPPIIIPEIGKEEILKIPNTTNSFKEVSNKIAKIRPQTIIVISSHNAMYYDYFNIAKGKKSFGSFKKFNANISFEVDIDEELVNEIIKLATLEGIPLGKEGGYPELDHGTMVPLYFINEKYRDYKLVRLGLSGFNLQMHYRVGNIIQQAVNNLGEDVVVIASGDMSHKLKEDGPYGLSKEGIEYDNKALDIISKGEFDKLLDFNDNFLEKAAECGHRCFVMLGGVLDGCNYTSKLLSYENVFGVGYGAIMYEIQDEYVLLARKTIKEYVTNKQILEIPKNTSKELLENKAGVFVSIHKNNNLRGCIGTIEATRNNIALEIIYNAISSCSKDPRFYPVTIEELPLLEISVDVLGETEEIDDLSKLDVKRYGVIVSNGFRRGLLLPNLEGVDTVEEQIKIALYKAGIDSEEEYTLERFEVIRHEM